MEGDPEDKREIYPETSSGEPDWSSRTEQSYRLERDRLIAISKIILFNKKGY